MTGRDAHGNALAWPGVDRCACGCKYWENDTCVDCGARFVGYHSPVDAEAEHLTCERCGVAIVCDGPADDEGTTAWADADWSWTCRTPPVVDPASYEDTNPF